MKSLPRHPRIVRVYLHVHTSNVDAISLYQKFGFEITDTIREYYKRLSPPDCYVLSKEVAPPVDPEAAPLPGGGSAAGADTSL